MLAGCTIVLLDEVIGSSWRFELHTCWTCPVLLSLNHTGIRIMAR